MDTNLLRRELNINLMELRNRTAHSTDIIEHRMEVSGIACALLIAVMTPLIRPLLVLLNTPASTLEWCVDYLTISLVGIAGMAYYNILSGIIRGLGDSVSALLYLLVATALNIVLDDLLFFVGMA